jgi:hypothetical protein
MIRTYTPIVSLVSTRDGTCPDGYIQVESVVVNGALQARIRELEEALREISQCTVKTDCGIDPMRAAGLRQAFEITSEIAVAALAPKEPTR